MSVFSYKSVFCAGTEEPVIEEQEANMVLEGRTCEIVCVATGRPLPDISWRRVTNNDDYVTGIQPVRNMK